MSNKKHIYDLLKKHWIFAILTAFVAIIPAAFTILSAMNNTNFLHGIMSQNYSFAIYAELLNILFTTLAYSSDYLFYVMRINVCSML